MEFLRRFRWVDGHADMWPVFRDGDAFRALVTAAALEFGPDRDDRG